MAKKSGGWRGWWKSLWEESVATSVSTSVATSITVSETVSVAPVSESLSVDPTPISSGDSVTLFRGDQEGLLVDLVASEADLANHIDVLWYPDVPETFTTDWNPGDWYTIPSQFPDFGLRTTASPGPSSQVESFGIRSLRFHSGYDPDGYLCADGAEGTEEFCSSGHGGGANGHVMLNFRKWFNSNSDPGGVVPPVCLGSTPITEAYMRWEFMIEQSFMDEFTEPDGFKLGGFMNNNINGVSMTMWLAAPNADDIANNRMRLATYWDGGDLATDPRWAAEWLGKVIAGKYVYVGQWHCIEQQQKMNTNSTTADGIRRVWFDDELVIEHVNCKNHLYTGSQPIELWGCRNQWYHGGQTFVPSGPMWARYAGWTLANRRIGRIKANRSPSLELDLNSNSWASTWNASGQRTNMEYSNAHQHTDGRQLEFSMAQHARVAGDNTGVRWADFTVASAPTGGYYWANDDTLISEHDNFPTAYLPWKGWVVLFGQNSSILVGASIIGQKIISIDGTPSAIFRNVDGADQDPDVQITDFVDVVYPTGAGLTAISESNSYHNSNYNPACWVNPSGTMTGWWGGGQSNSFPNGTGSIFKLLDDNPDYPGSSTKPLRLRVFRPTGAYSPTHMRHMVQIGDWLYWGGGYVNPDTGIVNKTYHNRFFRINVTDLASITFTQEEITTGPTITNYSNLPLQDNNVRFNLLCADQSRNWLIYMNINGVYRYKVPSDDGNDGVWDGPYTFGMTSEEWASTISDGNVDLASSANWHGLIGTHRSDLNQTFFRYNLSKKWNRITWTD